MCWRCQGFADDVSSKAQGGTIESEWRCIQKTITKEMENIVKEPLKNDSKYLNESLVFTTKNCRLTYLSNKNKTTLEFKWGSSVVTTLTNELLELDAAKWSLGVTTLEV